MAKEKKMERTIGDGQSRGRIKHSTRVKIFSQNHIQGEVVPSDFSESGLRITASWPVILRPRARSTFAPRASLFKLSDFSAVGTNRCLVSGLFSRRSKPSWRWEMSAIRGSPLGRLPFVRSDAASEGLPLTVENRLEARFCRELDMRRRRKILGSREGRGKSYRLSHHGALGIQRSLTGHVGQTMCF